MGEEEDKLKAEEEAKLKEEAEAKAKQEAEANANAEAETKAKEEAEAKLKEEAEAKSKAEAEAKAAAGTDSSTGKKLDEMKSMMENILKDAQTREGVVAAPSTTTTTSTTATPVKEIKPTGNLVEVDLLKGQYIFRVPEDWTETDKAKFNVIVTETIDQGKPLLVDSSIEILEYKKPDKGNK